MALSMDLKIRGQYGSVSLIPGNVAGVSGGASFSDVLSAAFRAGGATDYDSCFQAAADTYGVPVNLLKAVAKAESGFNADAVSHCGAQGIMQLMPATARSLGVTDSFDPVQNIMGGAKYLRQLLDHFDGNVTLALAGYNAGAGAVQKYGGVPPYKETQDYVAKVLGYAGGDISVPASTGSAAPAVSAALSSMESDRSSPLDSLTKDELLELVMRAYRSGGVQNEEAARLFLQRVLTLDEEEDDETWQRMGENDDYYANLKKMAMQVVP